MLKLLQGYKQQQEQRQQANTEAQSPSSTEPKVFEIVEEKKDQANETTVQTTEDKDKPKPLLSTEEELKADKEKADQKVMEEKTHEEELAEQMEQVSELEAFLDSFDFLGGRKSTEKVKLQLQEDYHTAKTLFEHGGQIYSAQLAAEAAAKPKEPEPPVQRRPRKESKFSAKMKPEDYKRHKLVEMLCKIVGEMKEIDAKKLEVEIKMKKAKREYSELMRTHHKVDFELITSQNEFNELQTDQEQLQKDHDHQARKIENCKEESTDLFRNILELVSKKTKMLEDSKTEKPNLQDPNQSPVYLARIIHLRKLIISEHSYSQKLNDQLEQHDRKLRDIQSGQEAVEVEGEQNKEQTPTLNQEYEEVRSQWLEQKRKLEEAKQRMGEVQQKVEQFKKRFQEQRRQTTRNQERQNAIEREVTRVVEQCQYLERENLQLDRQDENQRLIQENLEEEVTELHKAGQDLSEKVSVLEQRLISQF